MDTATKTGIDAAKTASKRVVQKTAEDPEDIYIPPAKRKQISFDTI